MLYLPPYSPDFNPNEKIWPKMKAILRCWTGSLPPSKRLSLVFLKRIARIGLPLLLIVSIFDDYYKRL